MESNDPISRRDAKEAIEARAKPYELGPHRSFEHGVYQGLMMARNSVCALSALDADGRLAELAFMRKAFGIEDDEHVVGVADDGRSLLVERPCVGGNRRRVWSVGESNILREQEASAPPAAERRPAVERPWPVDSDGDPVSTCGKSGCKYPGVHLVMGGNINYRACDEHLPEIDKLCGDLTSGDAAKREGE